jgi:hypothetical protein
MDTYREYLQLNEMWDNNRAPWWTPRKTPDLLRTTPRNVKKTA